MKGLVVTAVDPGGGGAEQGAEVGGRVVGLNGVPVSPTITALEFGDQLAACRPGPTRPAVIGLARQGKDFATLQRHRYHGRPGVDPPLTGRAALDPRETGSLRRCAARRGTGHRGDEGVVHLGGAGPATGAVGPAAAAATPRGGSFIAMGAVCLPRGGAARTL